MPGFVKRYADARAAGQARRRSSALAVQGVATPAVLGKVEDTGLRFQGIEGNSGPVLAEEDLAPLLLVVARLHRAIVPDLPRFDPFLRIRPRLSVPTRLPVADILSEPVPMGQASLHGDLHVGQFIRDRTGKVWVVDLDDLAIGPPEADLANFAAHLATTLPRQGIADCADRVAKAWTEIGQTADPDIFARFLRFALLRRHLKLRQAGRPDFEAEILDYLRESSNFSIL